MAITETKPQEVLDGIRRITLDHERVLRMDFNALAKAEELCNKNFLSADTWRDLKATDIRALTWACLVDDDSSLTIDQVGKLLTPKKSSEALDALLEMYIGEAEKPTDEDKDTAKLPLGRDGESGGQ